MRVAIVHDWLVSPGGAERVLAQFLRLFPHADVFAMVDFLPEPLRGFLGGRPIATSLIQKLPFARTRYRTYLPLMPLVVEQFDLSGYDVVISSTHAVAKGVITGPNQLHISYVHSPMRYAWDLQHQYLREAGLDTGPWSWLVRRQLHKLRLWDLRTANGVDHFIANSTFIARRIEKIYRRAADVVFPPVAIDDFSLRADKEDFYVTASRFVPYKRLGLIVDAFARMPGRQLVVIGEGPDFKKVRARAPRNVTLLGYQPLPVLRDYLQRAKAFVFAAEEDFGIAPLEAQACGTPVIAYGAGGVLDTVVPGRTGLFFGQQTVEALVDAVVRMEDQGSRFDAHAIRRHAEAFSDQRFADGFMRSVTRLERWPRAERT